MTANISDALALLEELLSGAQLADDLFWCVTLALMGLLLAKPGILLSSSMDLVSLWGPRQWIQRRLGSPKLPQIGLPVRAVAWDEAEHLCFWREQTSRSPLTWFLTRMAASEQSGVTQLLSCYSLPNHPLKELFESVLPIGRGCIGALDGALHPYQ